MNLKDKIARLESLSERERAILDFFMADRRTKVLDIAKSLHLGESTTRNALSDIFDKLEIPDDKGDRRSYMVTEYQEAYKERYLRVGEIPSDTQETPVITVSPQKVELSRKELIQLTIFFAVLAGIELIAILALAIDRNNLLQQIR